MSITFPRPSVMLYDMESSGKVSVLVECMVALWLMQVHDILTLATTSESVPDLKISHIYLAEALLDNFIVEASASILPEGSEYDASIVKGRLCAQFPGRPPSSPTELMCTSEAIGRYVYVHIPYDGEMTICEIEIYGKRMYGSFTL